MPTLVISAPSNKANKDSGYKKFEQILKNRIGPEYAIYKGLHKKIINSQNCRVVLLDKYKGKRAEGTLKKIEEKPGQKTLNHIQLYDVRINADLKETDWIEPSEGLNYCGVAFID